MTPQQPPRCHHDHYLGERVTHAHADPCRRSNQSACDGCAPCLEPHCSVCTREHLDDAHPNTCPDCVSSIREDLDEIARHCNGLTTQAIEASNDGRPWAAAPIPGALATVLAGPATHPGLVTVTRHYADDHRKSDPLPPLVVLGHSEDVWRTWLNQPTRRTASVQSSVDYLDAQLTQIAQARPLLRDGTLVRPPEFPDFAREVGRLRAQLEHAMHDEQEPDRGVDCFECGHRLVRRHRDRRRCHHETEARTWFATLLTYPELRIHPTEVASARAPCPRCDQGGLADPTPGISWECPCCRKVYTPGEYATAVRRDLLDSEDGDGWTAITLAADAATTLTGRLVPASTVRKWMDRGQVGSLCAWSPGQVWGQRLVFWPDVADRATMAGTSRRAAS